jgi:hypothetical protein
MVKMLLAKLVMESAKYALTQWIIFCMLLSTLLSFVPSCIILLFKLLDVASSDLWWRYLLAATLLHKHLYIWVNALLLFIHACAYVQICILFSAKLAVYFSLGLVLLIRTGVLSRKAIGWVGWLWQLPVQLWSRAFCHSLGFC